MSGWTIYTAKGGDRLALARAPGADALDELFRALPSAAVYGVALGDGLETDEEARSLVSELASRETSHRIALWTARGSVAPTPSRALSLVDATPSLSIVIDLPEWYLGSELVLGRFGVLVDEILEHRARFAALVTGEGGAERLASDRGVLAAALRAQRDQRARSLYRGLSRRGGEALLVRRPAPTATAASRS